MTGTLVWLQAASFRVGFRLKKDEGAGGWGETEMGQPAWALTQKWSLLSIVDGVRSPGQGRGSRCELWVQKGQKHSAPGE